MTNFKKGILLPIILLNGLSMSIASTLKYHVLNAGQANCAILERGDHCIIMDAGSANKDTAKRLIERVRGKTVDRIYLSHPHSDHINLLANTEVLRNLKDELASAKVYLSGYENHWTKGAAKKVRDKYKNVKFMGEYNTKRKYWNGAELTFYGRQGIENLSNNDLSQLIRIRYGTGKTRASRVSTKAAKIFKASMPTILFTGDANGRSLASVVARDSNFSEHWRKKHKDLREAANKCLSSSKGSFNPSPEDMESIIEELDLRSDIVNVPHHASDTEGSPKFWKLLGYGGIGIIHSKRKEPAVIHPTPEGKETLIAEKTVFVPGGRISQRDDVMKNDLLKDRIALTGDATTAFESVLHSDGRIDLYRDDRTGADGGDGNDKHKWILSTTSGHGLGKKLLSTQEFIDLCDESTWNASSIWDLFASLPEPILNAGKNVKVIYDDNRNIRMLVADLLYKVLSKGMLLEKLGGFRLEKHDDIAEELKELSKKEYFMKGSFESISARLVINYTKNTMSIDSLKFYR